jgi:hypothetical protein
MTEYNPALPKVIKWRRSDPDDPKSGGKVAGDVVTFVDDVRITGFSKENCTCGPPPIAAAFNTSGMQDAPETFVPHHELHAGAWTGTIFRIKDPIISKSVSQEKWEKGLLMR